MIPALNIANGRTAEQTSSEVAPATIKIMLCDDSLVVRGALSRILQTQPDFEVVARVGNGLAALEACAAHKPDIIILDIEMPVMDGLTALPLLLAKAPYAAVIMASTLSTRGAEVSMQALRLGAADTIAKPTAAVLNNDTSFGSELVARIRGVTRIRRTARASLPTPLHPPPFRLCEPPKNPARILAIGSSTGGPNALFSLVQQLGSRVPVPIVLTQHMPPSFTSILAQHLDKLGMKCSQATNGAELRPGTLSLAPGDRHLLVRRRGVTFSAELSDTPPENYCKPSVDPMLRSAAEASHGQVLVIMLTGMGQDGLAGSRQVVEQGGGVIAQDEATSVVWGMPGAVCRAGLAHAVLPLSQIGSKIMSTLTGEHRR